MPLLDLGGRQLVLASASPRRAQLLAAAGLVFEVLPADVDESPRRGESPTEYVGRVAAAKASAIAESRRGAIVLAADTTVDVDGQILGKPADEAELRRLLRSLSGRTHEVHTAVTVSAGEGCSGTPVPEGQSQTVVVTTAVTFVELTDDDVAWYVATGDGFDKAGGYGIQGKAAPFVAAVVGSVTNVIGLPMAEAVFLIRSVLQPA